MRRWQLAIRNSNVEVDIILLGTESANSENYCSLNCSTAYTAPAFIYGVQLRVTHQCTVIVTCLYHAHYNTASMLSVSQSVQVKASLLFICLTM